MGYKYTMLGQKSLSRRLKVIERRLNQLCCSIGESSGNYVSSYTLIHNIISGANTIPHGLGAEPQIVIVKDNLGYIVDFSDLNYDATNITLTSGKNYNNAIFEILIKI